MAGTPVAVETAGPDTLRVRVASGLNGDVQVTVFGEQSNSVSLNTTPVIRGVSPAVFDENDEITLTGALFSDLPALDVVSFGSLRGTVLSASPTHLRVRVPVGSTSGKLSVAVDGLPSNDFAYTMRPVITGLIPASGAPGAAITIVGKNFSPTVTRNTVLFNNVAATVSEATTTSLKVTAPHTTAEVLSGDVVVTSIGLTSNGVPFSATPVITGIEPTVGSAGDTVTIHGSNFSVATELITVLFNGRAATIKEASQTQLVVTAPSHPNHSLTGNVTITVAGLTSTAKPFTGRPVISNVALAVDSNGKPSTLTITGLNFSSTATNNTVLLDDVAGTVTAASATSLTVALPTNVTLANLSLAVNGVRIQHVVGPVIAALSPTSGSAGSLVEIQGANFNTTSNRVLFGSTSTSVNAPNSGSITVTIPSSVSSGALSISVIADDRTSNAVTFTVP